MKKTIVISIIAVFVTGCNEANQKRKPFASTDLKLGMQFSQVEQICNGTMELVSSETIPDSNGCSKTIYRMWPNETKTPIGIRCIAGTPSAVWAGGKDIRPYLLTFTTYPPLTKEDVDKLIELGKIDPNNQETAYKVFVGFVYNPLVDARIDTEGYQRQLAEYQQYLANWQKITEQRQPPTVLHLDTQPVIIQQFDNSLGAININKYNPNSLANPYGAGSPYKSDGLMNPYSQYGSPYSNKSWRNPYATDAPKLYDSQGNYRGKLSSNPYDPESTSNPYGRYGSRYSPDSINNPYGTGNPYSNEPIFVIPSP